MFLFSSSFVFAQQAWTHYSTANSPLPENSIRCIAIDALGKKWIGTDYGLSVFDDVTWTNYFTTNSGLPDNVVRAVAFDSLQNAWIGTFNGGLAKFDGTNWTVYDIVNSPLPDNSVRSLAFDSAGALWIGTLAGLAKFDGTNWITFTSSNSILTYDNIAAVLPVINNRVFVGTVNGGLAVVDNDTIKDVYTIANGSGIPDNTQVGFDDDSSGNVWMATPANGIVVRRIVGGWFWFYMGNSFLQSNGLSAIKFTNDESSLWVGTLDSGMIKKTGAAYATYNMVNTPMPDNNVQCFNIDSNNILWIGTATQGVVRFDESLTGTFNYESRQYTLAYPNPTTDFINVKSSIRFSGFELCNAMGKVVYKTNKSLFELKIPVSHFSSGFYFLKIMFDDGSLQSIKFIKE